MNSVPKDGHEDTDTGCLGNLDPIKNKMVKAWAMWKLRGGETDSVLSESEWVCVYV